MSNIFAMALSSVCLVLVGFFVVVAALNETPQEKQLAILWAILSVLLYFVFKPGA